MTIQEIYQLALSAGFPPSTAVKMTAIALKESGGNPNAHNDLPPDNSYGLWQINMIGSLGPSRRAWLGLAVNEQLFDPATNARAAFMLWNGSDANLDRHWGITTGPYAGDYQRRLAEVTPVLSAGAVNAGVVAPAGPTAKWWERDEVLFGALIIGGVSFLGLLFGD